MDDGVYKIQNLDDVEIKKIDDVDAGYIYPLKRGDIIDVFKPAIKCKLKPDQIWSEYPMLKCISRIYERHKWWQFWKWGKVIGYQMMYIGKD